MVLLGNTRLDKSTGRPFEIWRLPGPIQAIFASLGNHLTIFHVSKLLSNNMLLSESIWRLPGLVALDFLASPAPRPAKAAFKIRFYLLIDV